MAFDPPQLDAIVQTLTAGRTAEPTTIRTFLSWFEVQRRTRLNVEYVDGKLATAGVRTVPTYLNRWVDSPVTFELVSEHKGHDQSKEAALPAQATSDQNDGTVGAEDVSEDDPSFRIGNIASSSRTPTSVKPNASLHEAITLMIARNFSQLPVMTNEREVKGVISWTSIGSRLVANSKGSDVQSHMNAHQEIGVSASLFFCHPDYRRA